MPNNFRVKGAFFENDKQTGPAFTGFVEIDGQRTNIALWPKTSAKGVNYFQCSEDKKLTQQAKPPALAAGSPFKPRPAPRTETQPKNDMDDDIPF